jgi:hypothetical protein
VSSAKIPNVIPKIKLGISWENLILEPLEIQKKQNEQSEMNGRNEKSRG